ncbi:hypothetical protein AAJ76_1000190130 [Vairimorpha ceranae]|uniref:Uncharacterized protein n=1 Tax=Vairimorpha ceranae TaxID=40302 RepID=A0A0F9YWF3_9MICR|nr:hypothetical protein AAJ76_1000190130 [Vairimorpha ceranae]KAF5141065.1 hypothetical protein G9O61_00g007560 [Vairimorpha ceranae]KKO76732.1 hypothetical protein AAJ76_1000190130 [Vairimorpha ceranae]
MFAFKSNIKKRKCKLNENEIINKPINKISENINQLENKEDLSLHQTEIVDLDYLNNFINFYEKGDTFFENDKSNKKMDKFENESVCDTESIKKLDTESLENKIYLSEINVSSPRPQNSPVSKLKKLPYIKYDINSSDIHCLIIKDQIKIDQNEINTELYVKRLEIWMLLFYELFLVLLFIN